MGSDIEPDTAAAPVIDVDLVVADVRRRAAALRERGEYPSHLLDAPFDLDVEDPGGVSLASPIRLRPERGYSSKPVVGGAITAVKRVAERLVHHVVQDGLDQASIRIEHLARTLEDVERRADERIDDLSRSLGASESRVAEQVAQARAELAALAERVGVLTEAVTRLERRLEAGEGRSPRG